MEKETTSHKILHSFCLNPKLRFSEQVDGEKVILTLRAHPFTQIGWVVNGIILILLLYLISLILPAFITTRQIIIIDIFAIVFIFSYFNFNFINWFYNIGIITNKRVVDIDLYYIIYKEITTADLRKIEDVTIKTGGYLESLLNFGNIFIQTAGAYPNIEFLNVPQPEKVRQIINTLINQ